MLHDQVRFTPGMQVLFNIQKSSKSYNGKIKQKSTWLLNKYRTKAFKKTSTLIYDKNLQELGIEENFPTLI